MKVLLRSCFMVSPSDRADFALRNVWELLDALAPGEKDPGLRLGVVEDVVIWNFILDNVRRHRHVPDALAIRHHMEAIREDSVVKRLAYLGAIQPLYRGDFATRIVDLQEDRRATLLGNALEESAQIVRSGMEFQQGRDRITLKGSQAAIQHVLSEASRLSKPPVQAGFSRGITSASSALTQAYNRAQNDAGRVLPTGLAGIDDGIGGVRPGQLWVHAGFTGGMKSSFGVNWAYNLTIGHDSLCLQRGLSPASRRVLFYSLEMGLLAPHWMLVSMASGSYGWQKRRVELDLPDSLWSGLPLDALVDGDLPRWHENGRTFLNEVLADLGRLHGLGNVVVREPDPAKGNPTVQHIWQDAERVASELDGLDLIIVDHAGLVKPPKGIGGESWSRVEAIYQELHRMALGFGGGRGIAVLALHQINREGGKRVLGTVEKSKVPRYDLFHLSGGSEAERSADIVTTSYVDDRCRQAGRVLFDCLKSRLKAPFQPFLAHVDWPSRRLRDLRSMNLQAEDPGAFFGGPQQANSGSIDNISSLDI